MLRQRFSNFWTRLVGFLRFDPAAYRAILDDPDGLIDAMIVVIVASVLAAIGAAGPGFRPGAAVGAFFAILAQWAVGVGLAYFLSITLFRQPKSMSFMGVMPLFGLAQAPRAVELLGVLPIPHLVAASMLAGIALFFAYLIASLREAFGFDLTRAAINGGAGLLAAYAVMTAAAASTGSNADALGFPRPFAPPVVATPIATPLATPLATPRPALIPARPATPIVRPTRAPVVRHKRARATPEAATPMAQFATPRAATPAATPVAGKGGHSRRKAAQEATPVARSRGRLATPTVEASPGT